MRRILLITLIAIFVPHLNFFSTAYGQTGVEFESNTYEPGTIVIYTNSGGTRYRGVVIENIDFVNVRIKFDAFSTPEIHRVSDLEKIADAEDFAPGSVVIYTNSSGTRYRGVIIENIDYATVRVKFDAFSTPEVHRITDLVNIEGSARFKEGDIIIYTNSSGTKYKGVIIENIDYVTVKIKFDAFSTPEVHRVTDLEKIADASDFVPGSVVIYTNRSGTRYRGVIIENIDYATVRVKFDAFSTPEIHRVTDLVNVEGSATFKEGDIIVYTNSSGTRYKGVIIENIDYVTVKIKFDAFSAPEVHRITDLEKIADAANFVPGSVVIYTNSSGTRYRGVIIENIDYVTVKIKFDSFTNPEIHRVTDLTVVEPN